MRLILKIFISFCFIVFFFIILEIAVRVLWNDCPENYLSVNYYPSQKMPVNSKIGFDHIPNWSGYATGVKININSAGLRDVDEKNFKDKNIVLFSGDSIFFGYGLADEFTITNILNKKYSGKENYYYLNNGVCGYNLIQSFEKTKQLIEKYKNIKYVFYSFIHNDVEGLFQSVQQDTGFLPEIKSAYFIEPNKNNFAYRLLNLLLPEDITNPKFISRIGIRRLLIRYSKLYAYIALNLKKICWSFVSSERKFDYWISELKISETLIYEPVLKTALEIKKYMDLNKIQYSIIVPLDMIIEGKPLEKIIKEFQKNQINNYAVSLFLPDRTEYGKNFILGWDSHPNRNGTELMSSVIKKIFEYERSGDAGNKIFINDYELKLKQYFQKYADDKRELDDFINSVLMPHSTLFFSNNDLTSKHFVYGIWDYYPLRNGKITARMDGLWTSKYLSICASSLSEFSKIKLYFDEFQIGRGTKIFVNGKEIPFNVKEIQSGGYIEMFNENNKIVSETSPVKYFYEIYFEFDNCFKDDNNRIFGPFIKKLEFEI
ncbi:SGNH/GDSL hydrolase family protein [Candidatus Dependentiae bacterium]|nr:SGNH/GDSL hydrolase family protein [Candidatus Dependentiae bacterium]